MFFDGLLKQRCLLCLASHSTPLGLCQPCLDDMPWLLDPVCQQCALPCKDRYCGSCLSNPPYFDASYSVFSYSFPVNAMLQSYKYGNKLHLARLFGQLLQHKVAQNQVDWVLPMPMHPQRLKERGFNQALEIAKIVTQAHPEKLDYQTVKRPKHNPPQASLAWQARLKNIKGVFKLDAPQIFKDKRVAIVDDVMTTGASLNELAKTLKQAGASHVECWIVARTLSKF